MSTKLPRRHRILLALYPPSFRERYGDELGALVEDALPAPRVALDLALGAARAWIEPTFGGTPGQRQRDRMLATILTVFWSWSLVLLAFAAFSKMVDDPPVRGLRVPLVHAAFQVSSASMDVATGLIGLGALSYWGLIAVTARREHGLRNLLPATIPIGAGLAWLVVSWGATWGLLHFAVGHRLPLLAAVGLVVLLLAWALASVALAPICWVSIAVAMRRASLSVRLLRPGLIGAVAAAVCLVVVVVSMAITVASLRGPGGLAPTVEKVLFGYCVVPFAAAVTGVGLISGRRGLRADREASTAPPAPGPVEVGTRPPSS